MTISSGKECYCLGTPRCKGIGLEWTKKELDEALKGEITSVVFDELGIRERERLLANIKAAGPVKKRIMGPFVGVKPKSGQIKNWRVGEAIAEAYLTEHRCCVFPWPASRDERKKGSSPPGVDLIGFKRDGIGDHFVFGEVKTSEQLKYPPDVVYGRTGLERQITDIRDKSGIRDNLVRYLAARASNREWENLYKSAVDRYLNDDTDVHLFGVFVRDVPPNERDVRALVGKLAKNCPKDTEIEFLAIYLPSGSIGGLALNVSAIWEMRQREEDGI